MNIGYDAVGKRRGEMLQEQVPQHKSQQVDQWLRLARRLRVL